MFEFTEADLRSNKNGVVSERQKKWLANYARGIQGSQKGGYKVILFFGGLGFSIIFCLLFTSDGGLNIVTADPTYIIALCITILMLLVIIGISNYFTRRQVSKLVNPNLQIVEGPVVLDEEHSSETGSGYYVIINDVEFAFPEPVESDFSEGERFRFYYCRANTLNIILSYEKM